MAPGISLGHFVVTNKEHMKQLQNLARISSTDVVLDIGSGDGQFLKDIVHMTGCCGLGVEVDHALHCEAVRLCSDEIHAKKVHLFHLSAEDLKLHNGEVHFPNSEPRKVTLAYLFQVTFQQSKPVVELLRNLLESGTRVLTNSVELPSTLVSRDIKIRSWPNMDEDGIAESMARATGSNSGNGSFWLYRKMTKKELEERDYEDTMAIFAQQHGLNRHEMEKINKRLREQMDEVAWLEEERSRFENSEKNELQRLHAQFDQQIEHLNAEMRYHASHELAERAEEIQRHQAQEQKEFDRHIDGLREARIQAREELEARFRNSGETEEQNEEIKPCTPSAERWECLDCASTNPGELQVCEFCEVQRGTGLGAWAHSDAEWETRDGKTHCVPRTLEIQIQTNLANALQTQYDKAQLKVKREAARQQELIELEARFGAEIDELKRCKHAAVNKPRQLAVKQESNVHVVALKRQIERLKHNKAHETWNYWMNARENLSRLNAQLEERNDQIAILIRNKREASARLEKSEEAKAFLNKKDTCATAYSINISFKKELRLEK